VTESATIDESLLRVLQLHLVPGVGPRMHQVLLDQFGSSDRVLAASVSELRQVNGVGQKLAFAIATAQHSPDAQTALTRCRDQNYKLIQRTDEQYPRLLTEIHDAPSVLFCRGELLPRDNLAIGIVGSRRCTLYGKQQAEKLAGMLARSGMTVVSGLARGIDAAAHRGALAAKGRTIAVSATGLDVIYPPEHVDLARQVAESGAIVTESRLEQRPVAGLFPQRNRIISGMSHGVIIVEATRNSGALHTARHAIEQGREVMVLPGRVDSLASEGCHDLIRDGATLIRNVDDVLEGLGPLVSPVCQDSDTQVMSPRELTLNVQERQILNLVTIDPIAIDEVLRKAQIDPSRVLATLTVLEMKRMVRRQPGGMLVRISH
jgi:DNA processing protein